MGDKLNTGWDLGMRLMHVGCLCNPYTYRSLLVVMNMCKPHLVYSCTPIAGLFTVYSSLCCSCVSSSSSPHMLFVFTQSCASSFFL